MYSSLKPNVAATASATASHGYGRGEAAAHQYLRSGLALGGASIVFPALVVEVVAEGVAALPAVARHVATCFCGCPAPSGSVARLAAWPGAARRVAGVLLRRY